MRILIPTPQLRCFLLVLEVPASRCPVPQLWPVESCGAAHYVLRLSCTARPRFPSATTHVGCCRLILFGSHAFIISSLHRPLVPGKEGARRDYRFLLPSFCATWQSMKLSFSDFLLKLRCVRKTKVVPTLAKVRQWLAENRFGASIYIYIYVYIYIYIYLLLSQSGSYRPLESPTGFDVEAHGPGSFDTSDAVVCQCFWSMHVHASSAADPCHGFVRILGRLRRS